MCVKQPLFLFCRETERGYPDDTGKQIWVSLLIQVKDLICDLTTSKSNNFTTFNNNIEFYPNKVELSFCILKQSFV